MNHTAFFNLLKSGPLKGCYLFEGPEEYIKQQALNQLRLKLLPAGLEEMNFSDLNDPEPDALIAAAETLPFMSEKRLIVVRESSLLSTGKKAEDEKKASATLDYLLRIPPTAFIVFYVKGKADGHKKLYATLKKQDALVDFSPMSDAECADWIRKSIRKADKTIDAETAARLVFTVGRDAALLRQEMDKLLSYIGDRDSITAQDINDICTRSAECTIFQMVEAQVSGQKDLAFSLMKSMLRSGEDDFFILAMLLRQYRILYHTRRMTEERVPSQSLPALLGLSPYALARTQQQARVFEPARLKAAYDWLLNYEYDLKGGRMPQEGSASVALLRLEAILRGTA